MPHIENRIPELLARRRWKMRDLERATGIAYSSIHRLVTGQSRRVDLEHIEKICTALNCGVGDIFHIAGKESP